MSSSSSVPRFGNPCMKPNVQQIEISNALRACVISPPGWLKTAEVIDQELREQHKVSIQSCLSHGGFSQTFNVTVEGRNSPYCMKVAKNSAYTPLFKREAENLQTLQKLDPSHTVRLHSVFNYQFAEGVDNAVLVEQYGGVTLAAKYRMALNVKVPVSHIGDIAAQMVVFLRKLEKEGKVLGDITATNIVVSEDPSVPGSLKFIDSSELFNEGDSISEWYRTTRWYRSPMVLTGKVHQSERSFPIGCILFELITGKALFDTSEIIKKLKQSCGVTSDSAYWHLQLHLSIADQIVPMTSAFKQQVIPDVRSAVFLNDNPDDLNLKSIKRIGDISLVDRIRQELKIKPDRLVYAANVKPECFFDVSLQLLHRLLDYQNPPCTDEIMALPFFQELFPKELEIHLKSMQP